ncbi:MAG: cobalt/nickel transport system permease protein [Eubacteriales bacterium]|nr:cobalt/nickel transport system permease protein [Eubacteriales bacterium]
MLNIDYYAAHNRWSHFPAGFKVALSITYLLLSLFAHNFTIPLLVLVTTTFLLVAGARIPWRFYLRLLFLPVFFLGSGCAAVLFDLAGNGSGRALAQFSLGPVTLVVTPNGWETATTLFFRSLGAVASLYLLILTTPVSDLIALLRRLRVPSLLSELMVLTYRYLFTLLETAGQIYRAQDARLGYSSPQKGMRSLSLLTARLFVHTLDRGNKLYTAMEARGYEGEIRFLDHREERLPRLQEAFYIGILALLPVLLTVGRLYLWP